MKIAFAGPVLPVLMWALLVMVLGLVTFAQINAGIPGASFAHNGDSRPGRRIPVTDVTRHSLFFFRPDG
jgi:hypothetical protein